MAREISEYVDHEVFVAGAEDDHGNAVESWLPGVAVGIFRFDPGSASEPREAGRDRVIVQPSIFHPVGTGIGARDRVVARGERFDVEGGTREWPQGNVTTLRKVDG